MDRYQFDTSEEIKKDNFVVTKLEAINKNIKKIQKFYEQKANEIAKTNKFIGSSLLTLTKDDIPKILNNNIVISPKVDGVRYLLVITEGVMGFLGRDNIWKYFIDRDRTFIKIQTSTDMILDTEVYDKNGFLQVFVFDAIYIGDSKEINAVRQEELMTGLRPPGNDLRQTHIKSYTERTIDLSYITELFINKEDISIYQKRILINVISETYDNYKDYWIRYMDLQPNEVPEFDGLIFIDTRYKYYFFPEPSYGQYKWKPVNMLSFDLKLIKDSNGKLQLVAKGDKPWDKLDGVDIPDNLMTGKVYEFVFLHSNIIEKTVNHVSTFEFKEREIKCMNQRKDKTEGNSLLTLDSIYDSYMQEVKIKDIYNCLINLSKQTQVKDEQKQVNEEWLYWLSSIKARQIIFLCKYPIRFNNSCDIAINILKWISKKNFLLDYTEDDVKNIITRIQCEQAIKTLNEKLETVNISDPEKKEKFTEKIKEKISLIEAKIYSINETVYYEAVENIVLFIELNRDFDIGAKKGTKNEDKFKQQQKSIGKKLVDVNRLIINLKEYYKNDIKYETEYTHEKDRIFEYKDGKNKYYVNVEVVEGESIKLDYFENYQNIFEYDINLRLKKEIRRQYKSKPNIPDTYRIRKRIIYQFTYEYYKIHLIKMTQEEKNKKTQKTQKTQKAFIELHVNKSKFNERINMNDFINKTNEIIIFILQELL
jgi:hypothetical protein